VSTSNSDILKLIYRRYMKYTITRMMIRRRRIKMLWMMSMLYEVALLLKQR